MQYGVVPRARELSAPRTGRHHPFGMDDRAVAANDGLRPWPRLRDTWWVIGLAAAALAIFLLGFLVALRCGPWGCHGSLVSRLLDLDAIGGLPRLFTTALFLGAGFLAWRASR